MKVCYGILSSSTNGQIVSQLVNSLGCTSPVFIHHDYSQQPEFALAPATNATIIPDFIPTAWGRWSQAEAIVCLLEHALANAPFDYFQLLSETCLPIRSCEEFEEYLATAKPDACIGLIKVNGRSDDLGTLNYAWRYFSRHRLLMRSIAVLAQACLDEAGKASPQARYLHQGLSVIKISAAKKTLAFSAKQLLLGVILKLSGIFHPFNKRFHCYVGSTWFCLSRKAAEYLISEIKQNPALVDHYRNTRSPDESIFHTILGNSEFRKIADINHFISWQQRETGPDELTSSHFEAMTCSGKFFARKFGKSPTDDFRQAVINRQSAPERPRSLAASA